MLNNILMHNKGVDLAGTTPTTGHIKEPKTYQKNDKLKIIFHQWDDQYWFIWTSLEKYKQLFVRMHFQNKVTQKSIMVCDISLRQSSKVKPFFLQECYCMT